MIFKKNVCMFDNANAGKKKAPVCDVKYLFFCLLSLHQSNGWDPNDMFKFNEEKYGILSTYDSSLSTYT